MNLEWNDWIEGEEDDVPDDAKIDEAPVGDTDGPTPPWPSILTKSQHIVIICPLGGRVAFEESLCQMVGADVLDRVLWRDYYSPADKSTADCIIEVLAPPSQSTSNYLCRMRSKDDFMFFVRSGHLPPGFVDDDDLVLQKVVKNDLKSWIKRIRKVFSP